MDANAVSRGREKVDVARRGNFARSRVFDFAVEAFAQQVDCRAAIKQRRNILICYLNLCEGFSTRGLLET